MEKNKNKILMILLPIISLFVGAGLMYLLIRYIPLNTSSVINKSEKEITVNENGIADAVDKIYDSVVVVETYSNKKAISSGTGFVYKIDGNTAYILTNNHVIESGDIVYVIFTNNNKVETKIIGSDKYADIAVLSVKASDVISTAKIGSSNDAKVGDTVFAVGAPLDSAYSWTVTRGILSGKDRMVEVTLGTTSKSDYIMKTLQTDAAINSGNSGGPLANSNGEVIGITSMKLVSSGVEGIGFAIPIEDAMQYATKIISGESTTRPYLGVSMIELNDLYSLYASGITIDPEITSGVVINEVEKNSVAEKGGLTKGDIITKVDDNNVASGAQLRYYLYKHNVGDKIKITFTRQKEEKSIELTLKN